jgi:hypothetical protein
VPLEPKLEFRHAGGKGRHVYVPVDRVYVALKGVLYSLWDGLDTLRVAEVEPYTPKALVALPQIGDSFREQGLQGTPPKGTKV